MLHTLLEAFILVSLVVYMFLGDLRSTLIPTLAVPVSLIGTFFFLQLFGLSINLITLFALVLAIGVVVDDAIVVVEAVHAKMAREAPLALSGDQGGDERDQRRDHRHHPGDDGRLRSGDLHARAGRHLLPPVRHHDGHVHRSLRCRGPDAHAGALCDDSQAPHDAHSEDGVGRWRISACICFDRGVEKVTGGYAAILRRIVTRRMLTMLVIVGFAVGIFLVNTQLPTGFIPLEDQGIIYGIIQTPPGSTLEYTNAKSHELAGDRQEDRRKSTRSPRWPVTRF